MEHFYQDIEGWFDFEDLYREAVRRVPEPAWAIATEPAAVDAPSLRYDRGGSIAFQSSVIGSSKAHASSFLQSSDPNLRGVRGGSSDSPREARGLAPSVMVEVGVYKGRSCFFLAVEALNSGKNIHVVAVDRFNWPPSGQADFSRLRREHGLTEMISMIEASSVQAAHQFDDGEIDFVFIDADHEYESVKADIAAWWPKVKPGGILAGHDFAPEFPGVERAVREFLGSGLAHGGSWKFWPPRSWWVEKDGGLAPASQGYPT